MEVIIVREKTFDAVKYRNDFNKDNYNRVSLMLPASDAEINLQAIKAHASERGESVNAFLQRAIREQLRRDRES